MWRSAIALAARPLTAYPSLHAVARRASPLQHAVARAASQRRCEHAGADAALQAVRQELKQAVRESDAKLEGRLVEVEQGMHVFMGGVQRTLDAVQRTLDAIQRDQADMKSGLAAVQQGQEDLASSQVAMASTLAAVQERQAAMASSQAAVQERQEDLASSQAAMASSQAAMASTLAAVQERQAAMASSQAAMQERQEDLASSQAAMASSQAAMDQKLSVLIEDRALGASKGMLTDAHVARHRATAPLDLLQLLPHQLLGRADAQTELAKHVLAQLLEQRVPLALLRSIWRGLEACKPGLQPWVCAHGRVDVSVLGPYIGSCQDKPLRELLRLLKRVLVPTELRAVKAGAPLREVQVQELMRPDSAGVACIIAAALPQLYLPGCKQQREELRQLQQQCGSDEAALHKAVVRRYLPSREVEFDVVQQLEVQPGRTATIAVGEVKCSADYAKAVPQLGLRLAVLRWLVGACYDVPPQGVLQIGRMYVAGGRREAWPGDGTDAAQQQLADKEWGFQLQVHWV